MKTVWYQQIANGVHGNVMISRSVMHVAYAKRLLDHLETLHT